MLADSIANLKLLSYLLNKMRYCLTKEKEEEGSFFFDQRNDHFLFSRFSN